MFLYITLTSREPRGVWNHRRQMKYQSFTLVALCEGKSPVAGTFPSEKTFPFRDVIMKPRGVNEREDHLSSNGRSPEQVCPNKRIDDY